MQFPFNLQKYNYALKLKSHRKIIDQLIECKQFTKMHIVHRKCFFAHSLASEQLFFSYDFVQHTELSLHSIQNSIHLYSHVLLHTNA